MKIRITPCVCIDHVPTTADSVHYGMPELKLSCNMKWFTPYCPVCGRGGMMEYKSAYLAIKGWNAMQNGLWEFRKREEAGEDALFEAVEEYKKEELEW